MVIINQLIDETVAHFRKVSWLLNECEYISIITSSLNDDGTEAMVFLISVHKSRVKTMSISIVLTCEIFNEISSAGTGYTKRYDCHLFARQTEKNRLIMKKVCLTKYRCWEIDDFYDFAYHDQFIPHFHLGDEGKDFVESAAIGVLKMESLRYVIPESFAYTREKASKINDNLMLAYNSLNA